MLEQIGISKETFMFLNEKEKKVKDIFDKIDKNCEEKVIGGIIKI